MPAEVRFLSTDEALEIHTRLVERFGGIGGVRDLGLLESALYRPQTGYYADLAEMAAALFESLLMNHAFLDGNKRVAFFGTDVFLRLNGFRLAVAAADAHGFIIGRLSDGDARYGVLLEWIRAHVTALPRRRTLHATRR